MNKTIVFIHGGEGHDNHEEYLKWLSGWDRALLPFEGSKRRWSVELLTKLCLENAVYFPDFPCKHNAKYVEWKMLMDRLAAKLPDDTVYIGHSLGANFIAKYLYETGKKAKTVHLVAGCYGLGGGFDLPDSLEKLQGQADEIHIWYSTDDKVVDSSHFEKYKKSLPKAVIHVFDDR